MKKIVFIFLLIISAAFSGEINEYKVDVYFANGVNTDKLSTSKTKTDIKIKHKHRVTMTTQSSPCTLIPKREVERDGNTTTPLGAISALKLTVGETTLNKDHNTSVNVTALYDDNGSEDVTRRIEWRVEPKGAVSIKGGTLTALKDSSVTIQAKAGNILSNRVKLNIYWEVNGHRLPPEPDPKINNATLLGVDVNHNGVRDDVERWIYEKYKDKHPIHIDIAMQAARAYKLVLEHPEKAKEIRLKVNGPLFCGWYYQYEANEFNDPILVHERIDAPVKSKYFNTKKRKEVYWQYDTLLSGDSYDIPWADEMKSFCDFNTSKYDKE